MHLKLWVAAEHIVSYLVPVNNIIRTLETQSDDPASFHLAEKNPEFISLKLANFPTFSEGFDGPGAIWRGSRADIQNGSLQDGKHPLEWP